MLVDELRELPGDDVERLYAVLGGLLLRTMPDVLGIAPEEARRVVDESFVCFLAGQPPSVPCDWIVAAALAGGRGRRRAAGVPLNGPPESFPLQRRPFERALASLSPREREAVSLALTENLSFEGIAAALDVTPRYAEKLFRRATAKLRKSIEECS